MEQRFNFEASNSLYEALARNGNIVGGQLYRMLMNDLGSEKAASLFLMQCGFDGIKYEEGINYQKPNGTSEDAYNYVIFDANKVKIIDKTKI